MRNKKLVGYIDDQGEIHDNVIPVLVGHKTHSPYGHSWMQINQNFLKEFAARRDLGNEVLRVFTVPQRTVGLRKRDPGPTS